MSGTGTVITLVLDCDDGPADGVLPAIASVLRQSTPGLEVLLTGTERHRPAVSSIVHDDARVRWCTVPSGGQRHEAIVSALRDAGGDVVGLLTPNDMLLADHLERATGILDDPRVDAVVSRPAWVTLDGMVVPLPRPPSWGLAPALTSTLADLIPACAVTCRRTLLLDAASGAPADEPMRRRLLHVLGGRPGPAVRWLDEVTALRFEPRAPADPLAGEVARPGWLDGLMDRESWPPALRLDLMGHRSARQAIERSSPAWIAGMRAAVPDAIEAMAWDRLGDLHGEALDERVIEALRERVRTLEQERSTWSQGRVVAPTVRTGDDRHERPATPTTPGARPPEGSRRGRARARARDAAATVIGVVRSRLWDPRFDARWYRQRYPDVPGGLRTWIHWRRHGWREGRDPNPWFDTSWYLERYPDVAAWGRDPLEHYGRWGWRESRAPSPLFDIGAYRRRYPDIDAAHVDPLLHYMRHGRAEGRRIDPVGRRRPT